MAGGAVRRRPGASNYTFAEATASQQLGCWIGSHVRAFEFMGSAPALLVPDNLRSGVTTSHRYEPLLNRSYQDMATHYGTAILPARAGKPRDKATAEVGVLIAERWILASLRNERFTSLAEANTAIRARLAWLNNRRFAKLEVIEDRHQRRSTILTSQLPISAWHNNLGDPTLADAICDRILHTAHRIELRGESLRKPPSEQLTPPPPQSP